MGIDWLQDPQKLTAREKQQLTPEALRLYNARRSVAKADRTVRAMWFGLALCISALAAAVTVPGVLLALAHFNILP